MKCSLRALSQKEKVFLCSLEKEVTSGWREISLDNYHLLILFVPPLTTAKEMRDKIAQSHESGPWTSSSWQL